jgi:NitT/TauT family transport system ATP-binding protein
LARIDVVDVSHAFGDEGDARRVVALDRASVSARDGELVSLIGPSGCGKSTLLNIIGGLVTPDSGSVEIGARPVFAPLPKQVGFVFQENALFPWLTVHENILAALRFQGAPKAEHSERAREALAAVALADFADHYPRQLSGGMKQRAQLARTLSLRTDVLLMDEPFAALDEQTRLVLGEDLSVLLGRSHKTIVFVTHSLTEAVFLADRIAVFTARPGRIKTVLEVHEDHPRPRSFMTSARLNELRNELYELIHDEVIKSIDARDRS